MAIKDTLETITRAVAVNTMVAFVGILLVLISDHPACAASHLGFKFKIVALHCFGLAFSVLLSSRALLWATNNVLITCRGARAYLLMGLASAFTKYIIGLYCLLQGFVNLHQMRFACNRNYNFTAYILYWLLFTSGYAANRFIVAFWYAYKHEH